MVKKIHMHHGASFIGDNSIDLDTVVDMIHLLSDFIYFYGMKYVDYEDNRFMAVPAMMVDFAFHLMVDSGYKLLERCLRHSFDYKNNDLRKATIRFVKEDASGRMGLLFKHSIHASMKDVSYEGEGNDFFLSYLEYNVII